jgi:hypothetical protein
MDLEVIIAGAVQSYLNGDFPTPQDAADAYGIDVEEIIKIIGGGNGS